MSMLVARRYVFMGNKTIFGNIFVQSLSQHQYHPISRGIHSSLPVFMAKGKNKGGNKNIGGKGGKKNKGGSSLVDDDDDDDHVPAPIEIPEPSKFNDKMDKRKGRLNNEFKKIRGGAIRPDMFHHVQVNIDGMGSVSISDVSQITMVNPLTFDFTVYDPDMITTVATSLRECGMGVNPTKGDRDNVLVVKVSKPSKEVRLNLIKQCSVLLEKAKGDIRNIRKVGLDKYKKLKGSFSDDELKRLSTHVESHSDITIKECDTLFKAKETALLQ